MENEVRYSFIIPHYNTPQLLNRCVKSIPVRDDIEIIIVDDNSDVDKKPSFAEEYIRVVCLNKDNSKGAGRARNIGISQANGKWLLFPDADDYYTDGFIEVLDNYANRDDIQILFFSCIGLDSISLKPHKCADDVQHYIEQFDGSKQSLDIVKYKTHAPWCKMLLREFVLDYMFFFDEVKKGNDVKFSYMSSYFANRIEVVKKRLYVYTFNQQGITKSMRSVDGSISIYNNQKKSKAFLKYIGLSDMHIQIPFYNTALSVLIHQGFVSFLYFIFSVLFYKLNSDCSKFDYISSLETIRTQALIKHFKIKSISARNEL